MEKIALYIFIDILVNTHTNGGIGRSRLFRQYRREISFVFRETRLFQVRRRLILMQLGRRRSSLLPQRKDFPVRGKYGPSSESSQRICMGFSTDVYKCQTLANFSLIFFQIFSRSEKCTFCSANCARAWSRAKRKEHRMERFSPVP